MLELLRRLARALYAVPVIGRFALWSGLVVRLPTLSQRMLQLEQDQAALERRASEMQTRLAAIDAAIDDAYVDEHALRLSRRTLMCAC